MPRQTTSSGWHGRTPVITAGTPAVAVAVAARSPLPKGGQASRGQGGKPPQEAKGLATAGAGYSGLALVKCQAYNLLVSDNHQSPVSPSAISAVRCCRLSCTVSRGRASPRVFTTAFFFSPHPPTRVFVFSGALGSNGGGYSTGSGSGERGFVQRVLARARGREQSRGYRRRFSRC